MSESDPLLPPRRLGLDAGQGDGTEAVEHDAPRIALQRMRLLAQERGDVRRGAAEVERARRRAKERKQARASRGATASEQDVDGRDPRGLGDVLGALVRSRGWSDPVAVGSVLARWGEIVGREIAAHTHPDSFENGTVVVRCESTAWATQLRLMQHELLKRFDAAVGTGVVTRITVKGPAGPNWRRGPRTAPGGRGPRDTYG